MSSADSAGRPRLIMHPGQSSFRRLMVLRAFDLTPNMRRVVLGGGEIEGFRFYRSSLGPYVKLLVPPRNTPNPAWPVFGPDETPTWLPQTERLAIRTFTVRDFDQAAGELTLDFVNHGDEGIASRWAARARPGDGIGLMERGFVKALGVDWYVFVGDHTALPAIAQSIENLPPESRGRAFITIPSHADRQDFSRPDGFGVEWIVESHTARDGSPLVEAVRGAGPSAAGNIFVWAGAEARTARALRRYVRDVLQLSSDRYFILNYWRRGHPECHG